MSEEELSDRLAEADRVRATLRRCTIEWQAVGRQILSRRQDESQRSDDRRPAGG
jgi:hypothetical protein